MEHGNFANSLRTTTLERRKEKRQIEDHTTHEQHEQTMEATAAYVAEHKEKMIDQLAMSAMEAAGSGQAATSAKVTEPIENRDGLYQTAREVRDYFKQEGFNAEMETYENGYIHYYGTDGKDLVEATQCTASLAISWEK